VVVLLSPLQTLLLRLGLIMGVERDVFKLVSSDASGLGKEIIAERMQ
jgi:hypothetical protein